METVIEMYAAGCDHTKLNLKQKIEKVAHIRYEREKAAEMQVKRIYV